MHLTLSDGRIVERIFAGNIGTEADLEKFVAEARHELKSNRPLLAELWETVATVKKRRAVPTEAEEMSATT